jgi:hypothetical protein
MSSLFKNGILEDIDTVRHIPIGKFWDVNVSITPLTWLSPFIFFGLHLALNLLNRQLDLTERLYQAMIFTIAVEIATVLHAFGHILSGKMIRSAMDELLIASTRDLNLYHGDQSLLPGSTHLIRSLGGPLFNILVAAGCYAFTSIIPAGFPSALLGSLITVNLFFGLGGFLPIPTVDGQVIWREIIRSFRNKRQKA